MYSTYRDEEGIWEWRLAFDPNAQDVTGQSSLYIASILGNKSLVQTLLKWKVKCKRTNGAESSQTTPITPTRKRNFIWHTGNNVKTKYIGRRGWSSQGNSNYLCFAVNETASEALKMKWFLELNPLFCSLLLLSSTKN